MLICVGCNKGVKRLSFSRHQKGASGGGGTWALRAPISVKIQRPNLHTFKGKKFCTKCLRAVKKSLTPVVKETTSTVSTPAAT